jgi:hypothetical protein
MNWSIICLGNQPLGFGPYLTELEADEDLERHCPATEDHPDGLCSNGITADDHHIIELGEVG